MGEERDGLTRRGAGRRTDPGGVAVADPPVETVDDAKEKEDHPEREVSNLKDEIEEIRDDLGHYISELDRRRHEAFDLKSQMRKHTGLLISVGIGAVGIVGALVAWRVRNARRPRSLADRFTERVTNRVNDELRTHDLAGMLGRAAIGIAAAAAATAVKGVIQRSMEKKGKESSPLPSR